MTAIYAPAFLVLPRFFFDFLYDLVTIGVAHIDFVPTLVMPDMIAECHKDAVLIQAPGRLFDSDLFWGLALEYKNAGLNTCARLKSIRMHIYTRQYARILEKPGTNITLSWGAKDPVWEDHGCTSAPRLKKFYTALNEEDLRRLIPQDAAFHPSVVIGIVRPCVAKVVGLKNCRIIN